VAHPQRGAAQAGRLGPGRRRLYEGDGPAPRRLEPLVRPRLGLPPPGAHGRSRRRPEDGREKGADEWKPWFHLGLAHETLGEDEPALRASAEALKLNPYEDDIWIPSGFTHARRREWDKAEHDYSQAIGPFHFGWQAWFLRGQARVQLAQSNPAKWKEAVEDYSQAIAKHPNDWEVWFRRGLAYWALDNEPNNEAKALADLSEAIRRGATKPVPWQAWYVRGRLQVATNPTAALTDCTTAIEKGADNWEVWYWRARALAQLNKDREAVADYTEAIARGGKKDWQVWLQRGLSRLKLCPPQAKDAEDDFTAAIDRGSEDATAWFARGLLRAQRGAAKLAVEDFDAAVRNGADGGQVYHARGRARATLKDWDGAVADYTRAIERKVQDPRVWVERAVAHAERDRTRPAVEDYLKAAEVAPVGPRDWDEAAALFSRALGKDGKDWWAWFGRGLARVRRGKARESIKDFDAAVKLGASAWQVWAERGLAWALENDPQKARADFSEALWQNPRAWRVWLMRAQLSTGKDWRQAEKDASRAIAEGATVWQAWDLRGVGRGMQGRWAEALADHAKAVDLEPTQSELWFHRGFAHAALGQWDEAAADFGEALDRDRGNRDAGTSLAQVRLKQGKVADYRAACRQLQERFGETADPQTAREVAWTQVLVPGAVPDPAAVVALARRAVEKEPNNAGSLGTLGAAAYRAGLYEEALKHLQEAIQAGGEDGPAQHMFFVAMAHHRLGHREEAYRWADKAARRMEEQERTRGEGQPPRFWHERLALDLLRRETMGLFLRGEP
jgi:tetratricopeptide (TPR) repeat protein